MPPPTGALIVPLRKDAQVADYSADRAGIGQRQVHPPRAIRSGTQPSVKPVGVVFPDYCQPWEVVRYRTENLRRSRRHTANPD